MTAALVIGAGPAGLMAAEQLALAGHKVIVAEAMPSGGRKFLMAGKSGLNLTKDEPADEFLAAYGEAAPHLAPMLAAFGPAQIGDWARGLGQELFTGSTGRVFPKVMKASPLLRAWFQRLDSLGVELRRGWYWQGWQGERAVFNTPDGAADIVADVTVLACGGASWRRLGSDGRWIEHFPATSLSPFQPANVGLRMEWPEQMQKHLGTPVKGIALHAGGQVSRGEIVLSRRGLEGGGIYAISRVMRDGAALTIDLLPDLSLDQVRARLSRNRGKASMSNHLRKSLKLDAAKIALLMQFARPLPDDLAPLIKALPIHHGGARDMDEAISIAGGMRFDALDPSLMLRDRPGVFAAGEMLDWEAPTGGYLISACLASGRWAGLHAARRLAA